MKEDIRMKDYTYFKYWNAEEDKINFEGVSLRFFNNQLKTIAEMQLAYSTIPADLAPIWMEIRFCHI